MQNVSPDFFSTVKKSGRSVFQASSSHNHALLFLQSEEPKLAAAAISTKTGTLFNNSVHDEFIKAHHGCSKQDSDICELLYAKTCGKNSGITTLPWSSYAPYPPHPKNYAPKNYVPKMSVSS